MTGLEEARRPQVSVVIPTVGRVAPLRRCLESLAACDPLPSEVIVADQSGDPSIASMVDAFQAIGLRVLRSNGRGRGLAVNDGLRGAVHDVVLVTDDDCTVASDWVGVAGSHALLDNPETIVTGRVLASETEPGTVPSTIDATHPYDFTGELHVGALYAGNMACNRSSVLAFGGFDELVVPSAEDNDLCYRWLRAGRTLRYDPNLTVWHHDWRTREELQQLYVTYARGQGVFYAKHLRRRDLSIIRFVLRDVSHGLRGTAARLLRGRPPWSDWRQGRLRGLPGGLVEGWRRFKDAPP